MNLPGTQDYLAALPEIVVATLACIVLLIDLWSNDRERLLTWLATQFTLLVGIVLIIVQLSTDVTYAFAGTYVKDILSDVLKLFIFIGAGVAFLYMREYLRIHNEMKGEYFTLGLFAVLGMMVLASASHMITLYLGLELLSLSLYALVAMRRDSAQSAEAAMKYFMLGAIASGMLLYGMSMIYGATGSLDLREVADAVAQARSDDLILIFGLVFIVAGIAFKLGAVPFHMWAPDVYQGAPTAVTLFLATVPKLAAFAMLMRLLVDGLGPLHDQWQGMLIILAVLSMAIGNLVAIAQENIRRMLAYSTISHVGFLLLGVLSGTDQGYAAALFYTVVYMIMGLGAFGVLVMLGRAGFEADRLSDIKGLNQRSPWLAGVMLVMMFSMAGVPPFLGFWAKFAVLQEVVAVGLVWLAVAAVVFSIIGAFYYLRIVKLIYFDEAEEQAPIRGSSPMRVMVSSNGLVVLLFGLFPAPLLGICIAVFTRIELVIG